MLALALLAAVPVVMWLGQTVLLLLRGERPRWRIGAHDLPRPVKRANRIITYIALPGAALLYPILRGQNPWNYYAAFFPLDARAAAGVWGFAASVLYLALLYLAWMLTDNVRFAVRHDSITLARRLAAVPLTAILGALVEELLFRGMVLADLLRTLPGALAPLGLSHNQAVGVAVVVGALLFAGAHYIRRVKRYWTFPGHLALGLLLCTAFALTGNLWLPFGLHAGGILMLMGTRPLIRYTGPPWLVGASIFPYAGVVGIIALAALTANVWLKFRTTP